LSAKQLSKSLLQVQVLLFPPNSGECRNDYIVFKTKKCHFNFCRPISFIIHHLTFIKIET
jgi:hypothetical protein